MSKWDRVGLNHRHPNFQFGATTNWATIPDIELVRFARIPQLFILTFVIAFLFIYLSDINLAEAHGWGIGPLTMGFGDPPASNAV